MLHACPAFVQFVPLSSRLVRRRCRLVMASSETSDLREPLLSPTAGMEQNPDLAVRTHVDSHDATSPTHAVTSPANDYDSPFAVQFPQTPAFPDPVAQLAPVKTGTSRSDGNRVSLANKASMLPPLGRVVPGTTNRPPPGAMKSRLPASMGLGATLGSKDTVGLQRKERFVKLPPPKQPEPTEAGAATQDDDMDSWMVEASPTPLHGRVTVHALCEKFDKARLKELVRLRTGQDYVQWKYEALYTSYVDSAGNRQPEDSAIIFFEYGVVAFWGLTDAAEADVIRSLAKPCYISPLPPTFYEKDDIAVRYSSTRQPNMHNDVITISDASRYDRSIKIAISHALSQSTKLSVYEKMIQGQIDTVIHLPAELASTGMVKLTRKEIAQHIGRLFLHKSAINLLSNVLGTPEFFWSAADSLQSLYNGVAEYLELSQRVEVVNARMVVLHDMLEMLRDELNSRHATKLEWIIIVLIAVEIVIGLWTSYAAFLHH